MIWDDGSYVILGEEPRSFSREGWDLIPSDAELALLDKKYERKQKQRQEYEGRRKERRGAES